MRSMTTWHAPTIRSILLEAGRIALSHIAAPTVELKRDASIVTQADREVEAYIRHAVADGSDEATFLGEESSEGWSQREIDRALTGTCWVVDPIDGTAPYANHLPMWGISIGLMEAGTLTHGGIFLPLAGDLFLTSEASPSEVLHQTLPRDPDQWATPRLTPLPPPIGDYTPTGMLSLSHPSLRTGRYHGSNPAQVVGCAVFSVTGLLHGSYIGYGTRTNLWDVAASFPLLDRMGVIIEGSSGTRVTMRVTPEHWNVGANDAALWRCREPIYLAHDPRTIDYLRQYHVEAKHR